MTSIQFPQSYSTGLLVQQRIDILEDYKETKNIPSWKELKRTHRWGFLIPPKKLGMTDWIYVRNDVFQIYKERGMKKNDIIDNGVINKHYFLNGDRAREFFFASVEKEHNAQICILKKRKLIS